jgi:error-prone DNA polymerase
MQYVELHARSAFTFLDGASLPETLAYTCAQLQMPAMALVDRDGVYGSARFNTAAKQDNIRIKAHVGAEVHIKDHGYLPLLVEKRTGYQNLCRLVTTTKLRTDKHKLASARMEELQEHSSGLICLTGDEHGPLANALQKGGVPAAREMLNQLTRSFGHENVYVELQRHADRFQESRNQTAVGLAKELQLPILATNGVRYAIPADREIADVFTCIKNKCKLDTAGKLLSRNSQRYIRTPKEMTELFSDLPKAITNTTELSSRLEFSLDKLGYEFPEYPVPQGETMDSFLRKRTWEGVRCRYRPASSRVRAQIEKELKIIEQLGLAGYFLIVWDLVCFCEQNGILVQGRGSAANSAVCYSLGITAVDPIGLNLLFERFLSLERGEWPDIDLDLPSDTDREKVIQHVYKIYGKRGAAMTANVNTYRGRSAVGEVGKVLDFDEDTRKRLSKINHSFEYRDPNDTAEKQFAHAGLDIRRREYARYLDLTQRIQNLPRHLSQHSGGMVICQGQLDSFVPLEPATMPDRVVLQWDKDDIADYGFIKIDLLGLGMLAALKESVALIQTHYNEEIDLAHLPSDKDCADVYETFCGADTVGIFQIESRAQQASLPRNKPREFKDLVAQVALIRPGPITGNMTNPYLKRRQGLEPVTYEHELLKPILESTYGVPIYQEQMLEIARDCCGLTPGQAEELRRSMSHKRSKERMQAMEQALLDGMAKNKIPLQNSLNILTQIMSFASFGFPKSHSASFALLVKASGFIKVRYLAAFTAALLNNQPMGFYNPATIVQDAKRHGLEVKEIDVIVSDWLCSLERDGHGKLLLRLGLSYVLGLPQPPAEELVRQRKIKPFSSIQDLSNRVPQLNKSHLTTLALIGALNRLGDDRTFHRRDALWQVQKATHKSGPLLDGIDEYDDPSPLERMSREERLVADFNGTGLTVGPHAMAYRRASLQGTGIITMKQLQEIPDGKRACIAGHAVVRQRPGSAKGFMFMSIEDETGIGNVVVTPQFFDNNREGIVRSPFVKISGVVQNQSGVVHLKAHGIEPLYVTTAQISAHNFH